MLQPLNPNAPQYNELGDFMSSAPPVQMGLQPLVPSPRSLQEKTLQDKISQYENPQQGGGGFWKKVGHIAATIGNDAGNLLIPNALARIPGTQMNNDLKHESNIKELSALQTADRLDTSAEGEDALRGAQTKEATARTAGIEKANSAAAPEPSLAQAYAHAVQTNQPPEVIQHIADAITALNKPPAEQGVGKTTDIKGPDGKVHTMGFDQKTGKYDIDEGESGFKPAVTNNNAADNHLFQEQERGRGLLDAAEKQYRTAQQGANTMRDMLTSADAGNKMSAQMLPLEGALAITTAQGVHRINRTEVDQFSGGGSLYDKIASELSKVAAGQPIDASIRADIRKLTDLQEKSAYTNYKGAHESAVRRYKLADESPLPEPGGGAGPTPPKIGDVVDGHRFKGGDPGKPESWEKVKK